MTNSTASESGHTTTDEPLGHMSLPSVASLVEANSQSFLDIHYVKEAVAAFDKALRASTPAQTGFVDLDLEASGYVANPKGAQFLLNILPKGLVEWCAFDARGKVLQGKAFTAALTLMARKMNNQEVSKVLDNTRVALRVNMDMMLSQG